MLLLSTQKAKAPTPAAKVIEGAMVTAHNESLHVLTSLMGFLALVSGRILKVVCHLPDKLPNWAGRWESDILTVHTYVDDSFPCCHPSVLPIENSPLSFICCPTTRVTACHVLSISVLYYAAYAMGDKASFGSSQFIRCSTRS